MPRGLFLFLLCSWGWPGAGGLAQAEVPARLRAGLWAAAEQLILMDRGHYAQSWDRTAGLLKAKYSREQWLQRLKSLRQPLGALRYRKLIFSRFAEQLPEWPKGSYLLLRYQSSFAYRELAFEALTLQQESDGTWRLADYQLSR